MSTPIHIHPENGKLFEFRGEPRVLLCATEHYGAVMNRPFRFERYLADAFEKSQTLTRLFTLFRELQTPSNPYSTCKPESPDYIAPFKRVGPGLALDGQPKYDLAQWNPEFFDRLHRFVSLASDYGIIVELVLLSNTYEDSVWALNPLHTKNNVNDVEAIRWPEYMTKRHPGLFAWQCAHVRKMVEETNRYDNVFYEICNEPGGRADERDAPALEEVNAWQMSIAQVIRETESNLPNRHLVAGQQAFAFTGGAFGGGFEQPSDESFRTLGVDIVNIHPLPNTTYGGRSYAMGAFMSKQLALPAVRDFCLATYGANKPLNLDEDNTASQYKDCDGWTIHRKRAWTALLCGGHYDYIDFSIINYCETGTAESQRHIRTWMKHLSEYIHSVDLVRARPMPDTVREHPEHTVASVLAVAGEDYSIYLADGRELTDPEAGSPIEGHVVFDLPAGTYEVSCYAPTSGLYAPWVEIQGGNEVRIAVPSFAHDIVVRIRHRN